MFYLLAVFAVPISLADIREFKIPNIYLKVLALFTAPLVLISGLGKITHLLIILICLIFLFLLGIGMGDIKLLALISISLNSNFDSIGVSFPLFISLIASIHLLLIAISRRSMPSKIPLAPSIFLAIPFI